jgi:hypothetical protein
MTNLDHRPPPSTARSARMRRAFDGIVASYIRDISGRGARRELLGRRRNPSNQLDVLCGG